MDAGVAAQMAAGARERLRATYGLATTGVAGPDPQFGHPPGEVYVAVSGPGGGRHRRLELAGDRAAVRAAAVTAALRLLAELLAGQTPEQGKQRADYRVTVSRTTPCPARRVRWTN